VATHCIYFQVQGEHGFVWLGMNLLLGVLTRRCGSAIIHSANDIGSLRYASTPDKVVQTSLVGFAVGGPFLSLVYIDISYHLFAAALATKALVDRELAAGLSGVPA
jgi:putative inorganic carbon (HCO3(-)) transporter